MRLGREAVDAEELISTYRSTQPPVLPWAFNSLHNSRHQKLQRPAGLGVETTGQNTAASATGNRISRHMYRGGR